MTKAEEKLIKELQILITSQDSKVSEDFLSYLTELTGDLK